VEEIDWMSWHKCYGELSLCSNSRNSDINKQIFAILVKSVTIKDRFLIPVNFLVYM